MGVTYIYALWNRIAERLRIVDRVRRRRHVDWYVWDNGNPRRLDDWETDKKTDRAGWYVWDHGNTRPFAPRTSTSGPDKPLQPGEPTMDLLTPKEDR